MRSNIMKIALIGYGKMGKMIELAAISKGHTIIAKINSHREMQTLTKDLIDHADVCIDFTHPNYAIENIKSIAKFGKNIVMGTTGWYHHIDMVEDIVKDAKIGFLYSPNFSLGVALFLEIVSRAASLVSPFKAYDVGGYEIHHNQKADSPSGTAKAIVERLLSEFADKKEAIFELAEGKISTEQLHFSSLRLGSIPGTHSITFDSPVDTITLTHTARNREGFAVGAVNAAEWLQGRKGFFTLNDMLFNNDESKKNSV